jgi:hypothetical protein
VVCGLQGIRLRVDQDPWMTDEEERSRYVDDVLLIGSAELLMAVDGRLMVVARAINTMKESVESVQEEALMVLMAETGNSVLEGTYPVEVLASDEGQGGSLGNDKVAQMPSTPSTEVTKEPVEGCEDVDGSVDDPFATQHEPATSVYRCSVYGCNEPGIVHSEEAEEEERTYGLWCPAHQDRSETMRLGMPLEPVYPRVEYAPGHTMCEGRLAWLRFHMYPQVGMVRQRVIALIEEQWREIA